MATSLGSAALQSNQRLRQYILNDVSSTGKTLGTGSYGSVLEVKYGKLVCAAKKMHDILLQQDNEGVESVVTKYYQECQLMANLRHPNITQFLGICLLPGNTLPLLVMERLEMSLDDLLEGMPHLQLPLLLSLLEGVSNGLDYLHSRQPSVVHRDLTAKNVLLSSSLVAKISDMGNSRIVDVSPGQLATLSRLPGTQVYMPPEAVSEDHRYGPSLDIFSFGHLALFTLIQEFPCNLLPHTYADPTRAGRLLGRSEVERRSVFMEKLEAQLGQSYPGVVQLVRCCLDNAPDQRPSSGEVLSNVRGVKMEVDRVYGGGVLKQLDIGKVLVAKEMKRMQRRIEELERAQRSWMIQVQDKGHQLHLKDEQLQVKDEQLQDKDEQLQDKEDQLHLKDQQLQDKEDKLRDTRLEVQHQQQVIFDLRKELQEKKQELRSRPQHAATKNLPKIRFPLNLKWTPGPDMPFSMSGYIQSVIIQEMMYVGGGGAYLTNNMFIVMTYNIISQEWSQLPQYTARYFAMTVIHNKLTLAGGLDRNDRDTSVLGVWDADGRKWTHPYTPMPTPHSYSSVVVYRQWLIVAGGWSGGTRTPSVEVLDISSNQWYRAPSTPVPWSSMLSAVVGDTWYLMGGYDNGRTDQVYSVSLSVLITHINNTSARIWNTISSLGLRCSTPVCMGKSLLAVGGSKSLSGEDVSTILHFIPDRNEWREVGQLTAPLYDVACSLTSNNHFLVAHRNKFHIGV